MHWTHNVSDMLYLAKVQLFILEQSDNMWHGPYIGNMLLLIFGLKLHVKYASVQH